MVARRRQHEAHERLLLRCQDRPQLGEELAVGDPGIDSLVDIEAVFEIRLLEPVARVKLVHVPEVRDSAHGRERRVAVIPEDGWQAMVLVARVPLSDHPDRQRVQRVHDRELGVGGRAKVGGLVVVREVDALARERRQVGRDRLPVDLQPDDECLGRLGAQDDQVLAGRRPEELRRWPGGLALSKEVGPHAADVGRAGVLSSPEGVHEQIGQVIREQADRRGDLQPDRRVAEDAAGARPRPDGRSARSAGARPATG